MVHRTCRYFGSSPPALKSSMLSPPVTSETKNDSFKWFSFNLNNEDTDESKPEKNGTFKHRLRLNSDLTRCIQ